MEIVWPQELQYKVRIHYPHFTLQNLGMQHPVNFQIVQLGSGGLSNQNHIQVLFNGKKWIPCLLSPGISSVFEPYLFQATDMYTRGPSTWPTTPKWLEFSVHNLRLPLAGACAASIGFLVKRAMDKVHIVLSISDWISLVIIFGDTISWWH